jgi:membrane fusion protein (multidrug efflux system)
LELSYTRITAPFDGVVTQRTIRNGTYVSQGASLLAVVPLEQAYVVANLRETQLARIRPGQHATVEVDALPGQRFDAVVDSLAPATGLEFAPIKPANATGNFTKVVQRVPVKLVLMPAQSGLDALRAGMSVVASIDVAEHRLAMR